jgi:hypothetical protein
MNKSIFFTVAVFASAIIATPLAAQRAGGPAVSPTATPEAVPNLTGNTTQDQINVFGNYSDVAKRLTKADKTKGKTIADLLAQDKADAITVIQSAGMSCDVAKAVLVSEGPTTVDGATVNTKSYEVSCSNGMGYFLVSQEPGKPYGFTCFGAGATRDSDVAAGRKPNVVCGLPENSDMKAMASAILKSSGQSCPVRDYRWIGQSAKSSTDYTEIACSDHGFIAASPLPGSTAPLKIVACRDAYLQGIPCKLSDNGAPVVTMQTFRDALAQHQVTCTATNSRPVGKESIKQRHIVEFQCPEHPKGLVAYIPLEGNTVPFEAIDCETAAKRGVRCTLTK